MRAFLMHRDRDADLTRPLPTHAEELERDLALATLYDAMGGGDPELRSLARLGLLLSLDEPEEILYRQQILADCLEQPAVVRDLHSLAVEAVDAKRRAHFFWFNDSPDSLLQKSLSMLEPLTAVLRRLRRLADEHHEEFRSDGFNRFLREVREELSDQYLVSVERHLRDLRLHRGVRMGARLGRANRSEDLALRTPREHGLLERVTLSRTASHGFSVSPRDEYGARTLAELRGRGIARVASAVAQATDHVLAYFTTLRAELGFYVSCLNLYEQLVAKGKSICFPIPCPTGSWELTAARLYDPALAMHLESSVVGSDVHASGKRLIVVTGANQGGKSTFLRSAGIAQLMLQAGMFAPADSFSAAVCTGVFTHFKREEDRDMRRGKLDEELHRMSRIVDRIEPAGLLLCNESFASTNEREGSELARQAIVGLTGAGVRVVLVTHLYDLARSLHAERRGDALFLRADRNPDGSRPFRLREAAPLPTSYGIDSFRRIFGTADGCSRGTEEPSG